MWEPLRLHFTPRNVSLTTYQEDYLFQRLLPAAAEWPVSNNGRNNWRLSN